MTTRQQALETGVHALVTYHKKERAGDIDHDTYNTEVLPHADAAYAAGWTHRDLHGAADREYGQWLIDNAGK